MPTTATLLLAAPSPGGPAGGGGASTWLPLFGMIGAIVAALVAGAVALYQRRKSEGLEREKLELERQKLAWEREKVQLTLATEKAAAEEERRKADERAAQEAEQARLLAEASRGDAAGREARYRVKLRHELSQLKILDMTRPLDLDTIYVQVRITERVPPRYVDDDVDPHAAATSRSGPAGGANVTSESVTHSDNAPAVLPPSEALRRFHRIVVLGDPGAGKTTMLKHVAFRMLPGSAAERLPIFVELRRFVDSGQASLVQYVRDLLANRYGFALTTEDLEKRLDDGEAALLLDGLDEVLGDRHAGSADDVYDAVGEEINRLATRFPDCPIAVTCRVHGWREGLPAFRTLEALDFDLPQVTLFIRAWYRDRPAKGEALLRALGDNQRLLGLAGNPLLLSLIAIVYDRDLELPERRAALYRRCVDVLLREWDSHRKIKRLSKFTTDRKADLLKHIAWTYHREGRRYLETDDLLAQIATFLPSVDIDPAESRSILDEIATQYGLLKEQAVGWYGFLHLTLQEFFAATALLERGQEGIDLLVRKRFDPWWEEVILLFAGATPDAGPLLRRILGLGDEPGRPDQPLRPPTDDIFHSDLFLAARCLVGAPRISDPNLRGQILATVRSVVLGASNSAEAGRAARVLAESSGWPRTAAELDSILAHDLPLAHRSAIVESLAETRRPDLAEWFLTRVESASPGREAPTVDPATWEMLVGALGVMRWQPAYDRLRALRDELDGDKPRRWSLLDSAATIVDDAGLLLRDLRKYELQEHEAGRWQSKYPEALAAATVSPAQAEEILDLLLRDNHWFFERGHLAQAYLAAAGPPGPARLLEIATDPGLSPRIAIPVAAAVADDLCARREVARMVAPLMKIVNDRAVRPEVLWLVTECLDHVPPQRLVDAQASSDPDDPGALGLAITRLAWGDRAQLSLLRAAVAEGSTDLAYSEEGNTWYYNRRVWNRLLPAVARYDKEWVVDELTRQAFRMSIDEWAIPAGLGGLFLVDTGAALRELVSRCESGHADPDWQIYVPVNIAKSLIPTALTVLELFLRGGPVATDSTGIYAVLLRAVSAVADDEPSLRRLTRLVPTSRSPQLYEALAEVARRAKLRVMPGDRLVPLDG